MRVALTTIMVWLGGCGLEARTDGTTSRAMPVHVAVLAEAPSAAAHLRVPPGRAWNAMLAALHREVGVQSSNPAEGLVLVAFRYDRSEEGGVAYQTAFQPMLRFSATEPGSYAIDVDAEALVRSRATCEAASAWEPVEPSADAIDAARRVATEAIAAARDAGWAEVRFAGEPADVLERLTPALDPYVVSERSAEHLGTDWRVTEHEGRGVVVTIRSRIEVHARAVGQGLVALDVVATLQRSGRGADGETGFVDVDAERIRSHAWAAASRVLDPLVTMLPDETPEVIASDVRSAPELEVPVDPGVGAYDVFFAFTAPAARQDGSAWDAEDDPSGLVRVSATEGGAAVPLATGDADALRIARRAATSIAGRRASPAFDRVDRMVLAAMAPAGDPSTSPDLAISLSEPDGSAPLHALPIARNALAAGWAPLRVELDGAPRPLAFRAFDVDPNGEELIGEGTVDVLEVARGCDVTTVPAQGGGTLRAVAVPARAAD